MLKYILAAIILPILVFLMGAFSFWEINPANWQGADRVGIVCFALIAEAYLFILGGSRDWK